MKGKKKKKSHISTNHGQKKSRFYYSWGSGARFGSIGKEIVFGGANAYSE